MKKNEFIIYKDKNISTKYFIFGLVVAIVSMIVVFVPIKDENMLTLIFIKSFCLFFSLFMAFGSLFILISKKEYLKINDEGITDNSSAISLGFIPWEDIIDVYDDNEVGVGFLELVIDDEEKYLSRTNFLKREIIKMNKKMGHQCVCINLEMTGYTIDELREIIQKYRQ